MVSLVYLDVVFDFFTIILTDGVMITSPTLGVSLSDIDSEIEAEVDSELESDSETEVEVDADSERLADAE